MGEWIIYFMSCLMLLGSILIYIRRENSDYRSLLLKLNSVSGVVSDLKLILNELQISHRNASGLFAMELGELKGRLISIERSTGLLKLEILSIPPLTLNRKKKWNEDDADVAKVGAGVEAMIPTKTPMLKRAGVKTTTTERTQ